MGAGLAKDTSNNEPPVRRYWFKNLTTNLQIIAVGANC
jgi:hypothetical protein